MLSSDWRQKAKKSLLNDKKQFTPIKKVWIEILLSDKNRQKWSSSHYLATFLPQPMWIRFVPTFRFCQPAWLNALIADNFFKCFFVFACAFRFRCVSGSCFDCSFYRQKVIWKLISDLNCVQIQFNWGNIGFKLESSLLFVILRQFRASKSDELHTFSVTRGSCGVEIVT